MLMTDSNHLTDDDLIARIASVARAERMAAIVAQALKRLRQETERIAFAATKKPRPGHAQKPGSRHIPAHVERAVWQRDDGQCALNG